MRTSVKRLQLEIIDMVVSTNDATILKKVHFLLSNEQRTSTEVNNESVSNTEKVNDILTPSRFKKCFLKETEKNMPHLYGYICDALGTDKISQYDMTEANLLLIRDYLTNNWAQNSARTYCAIIKSFLNKYADKAILTPNYVECLTVEEVESESVYLTPSEIELIERYTPKNRSERIILNAFLITCYCGVNGFDLEKLSKLEVQNGYIPIESGELKESIIIPANPRLIDRIKRAQPSDYPRTTTNRLIKRICKKVGITEEVEVFRRGTLQKKPKCDLVMYSTAKRSFYENRKIIMESLADSNQDSTSPSQLEIQWG